MSKETKNKKEIKKINLKKFDMRWIGDNKIIIFIGKRNTGKSCLVLDYLYHHSDIPIGTVISPTDAYNNTYKKHIPGIFIHDEFTPELIENFLLRQKDIIAKKNTDPNYYDVDARAFLILDDCLYDAKSWVNDKNIKWIFMNGRHADATMLLTAQYVMGIPPNLRTNVDYIFICKEPKVSNKKKLWEHYCGMFPTFEMFDQVLTACTDDYGCLVIDNSSISSKIEDQVFHYKANIHEDFRMCYDIFWENNNMYMKSDKSDKNGDDDSLQKYSFTKNKINFMVNKT
jgi:hypothetical protein